MRWRWFVVLLLLVITFGFWWLSWLRCPLVLIAVRFSLLMGVVIKVGLFSDRITVDIAQLLLEIFGAVTPLEEALIADGVGNFF